MQESDHNSGSLLYRPDWPEGRERLARWWWGEDIGRPALIITAPRAKPVEQLPELPEPAELVNEYATHHMQHRIHKALLNLNATSFHAEAAPFVHISLGPNTLAAYLGSRIEERPDTTWFHPCIDEPESYRLAPLEPNPFWDYTRRLGRAFLERGRGKFLVEFPDLIEGLDTIDALRGTQQLLMDLITRPDWVREKVRRVSDIYFDFYDPLYDMLRDETGGSHWWTWAPGRLCKLQCDFSAMIAPDMFRQIMQPELRRMARRFDHAFYHWDGPGAIGHLDALLEIDELDLIQWTPGYGAPDTHDPQWWPLYHRMLEAGKPPMLILSYSEARLRALRREFGDALDRFMFLIRAESEALVPQILRNFQRN